MGTMHGILKRLDDEAINRALGRLPKPKVVKSKKSPRHFSTYRGYRRNVAIHKRKP